jgi:hypothetical protein
MVSYTVHVTFHNPCNSSGLGVHGSGALWVGVTEICYPELWNRVLQPQKTNDTCFSFLLSLTYTVRPPVLGKYFPTTGPFGEGCSVPVGWGIDSLREVGRQLHWW